MRIETKSAAGTMTGRVTAKRRGLVAAGALALVVGSLAFSAPAFAQEEDDENGEMTEGTTVTVGDSAGTTVETAASGEAAAAPAAPAAPDAAAAPQTAAAPAAAAGAAAPTTLPSTGVGDPADVSLPLIGLAAAGAVAAGAVAVNRSRPSAQRAGLR